MLDSLSTFWNVVLMLFGFGLLIAVHELGHFLAARWAGIRVHAFAIGFGQALVSWRKGLGFRRGSSQREYDSVMRKAVDAQTYAVDSASGKAAASSVAGSISPTEYRLNWFPFGGYVRMLGQEDGNPGAVSHAPDSYTSKPVWKRMVVISGGVVMNLIAAALLFMAAFLTGLLEAPAAVGGVLPGSPAAKAGLRAGDVVTAVDGDPVNEFKDLALAAAMAGRDTPLALTVRRPGEAEALTINATPVRGDMGLLQLGISPAQSNQLAREVRGAEERATFAAMLENAGLPALEPGSLLVSVNGQPVETVTTPSGAEFATVSTLQRAVERSGGEPVRAEFRAPSGTALVPTTIQPRPALQTAVATVEGTSQPFEHLLGLTPVMAVELTQAPGERAGLKRGDVFVRIGSVEWPSVPAGMAEVRANKGKTIDLTVLRDGALVNLSAPVSREGRIGFLVTNTASSSPVLASTPEVSVASGEEGAQITAFAGLTLPAAGLVPGILPGSRLVAVAGSPVTTLAESRSAFLDATREAFDRAEGAAVPITLALPVSDNATETRTLALTADQVKALHALGWDASAVLVPFEQASILVKASNPVQAVMMGVRKTHYVMTMTYLTILRLVQGTVPVEQLQGPVGITHIGSRIADQGFVYLIFFLGLLSANLAVVNFLPVPVVDGGHMVFLAIEGITGKPVSIAVQNVATLIGLALIGTMFIIVTYNDIVRLFG